ncbi:MAG: tetratricopeptide repeat protein [Pseudomonadota bacterium]
MNRFPMLKIAFAFCILFALSGCTESPDDRFMHLNRQGIDHYARREYPEAIAAWQAAHLAKPADGSVLLSIATAYLKLAALPQAIETLEEAVRLFPGRVDMRCELVRLLLISRNITAAETQLQEVQKQAPNAPQTEILNGDLFLYKNLPDLSEKSYKIAASYSDFSDIALIKLAFTFLVQGKTGDAGKTYQLVADMAPARAPVLLQMHYFWKFKEDFEKAEAFIQQALALEPDDLSLRWELAEFYFCEGNYEMAQACMVRILKETPENRSAVIFLIEILMARNELQAAGTMLDKLAAAGKSSSGIALLQGKYHLLSNAPILAVDCFKKALDLNPTLTIGHYLLGLSYLADGRRHLARASLSTALKLDPLFTDAELLLTDLYYEQDEFDLALIHAARIADREKENYRAHLILGHIHLAKGQIDPAGAAYSAARKLHPDSIAAIYYSALAAETANQREKACALYKKLLDSNPGLADVGLRYCRLLIRMGDAGNAKAYFEQAAQKDPENGYLLYILGEAYLAADQPAKAKDAFQTAVTLTPHLVSAYRQLEIIAERTGDLQSHIQLLNTCIENNPTDITAYLKLAQLYRREWRWEKASKLLQNGLSRNPDSAWLENSLAWIYLEQDLEINKALELAKSAHEKLPEAVSISDTLGWAFHKKGLYQQAVWVLKEAAVKDPLNAMVTFHLGLAQHAGGELETAKENLQHALALKLTSPYRDEAETLLEKMNHPPEVSSEAQSISFEPRTPDTNTATDGLNKVFNDMAPKMPATDISIDDVTRTFSQTAPGAMDKGLEDLKPEDPERK